MSPSLPHEEGHGALDLVVRTICEELEIDVTAASSTLYRLPDRDLGIEPDQSYYFGEHCGALVGVTEAVNVRQYPPPDLVIEAVWSHSARTALEILREMGVPEVWHYEIPKARLRFLHLTAEGFYEPGTVSRIFPFLTPDDVLGQLRSHQPGEPLNRWTRRLRTWVRDVLGPRRAGG